MGSQLLADLFSIGHFPQFPGSELMLGLRPASERWRYFVMTSLIGWAKAYNQPCGYWMCCHAKGCGTFGLFHWSLYDCITLKRSEWLSKVCVKLHVNQQQFSNMASDWLAAVLATSQMAGLKIFVNWHWNFLRICLPCWQFYLSWTSSAHFI